jgi:hypothetical protein
MPDLRFEATPKQWALIGVLIAVLVAVLVFNQPAESAADSGIALAARPPAAELQNPKPDAANQRPRLPEFTADQVAAYNPFARPKKKTDTQTAPAETAVSDAQAQIDARAKRKAELEKVLADLRSKGVRFVIGDKNGAAAMLGDQWIRAGQVVSGFRVIKVDQSGVELVPAD